MNTLAEKLTEKKSTSIRPITGHGRIVTATVLSVRAQKTATVFWDRRVYIPKFERYLKKRTKLQVHNPPDINAQPGDLVRIQQTRPVSKTKHFVIIERQSGAGRRMVQDLIIRERKQGKKAIAQEAAFEKEEEKTKEEKTAHKTSD